MFCYRNIGNISTFVLLGIQIPETEYIEFMNSIRKLNGFVFEKISEQGEQLYKMFLE